MMISNQGLPALSTKWPGSASRSPSPVPTLLLAAGADRDVSEVRAELRAHTQGLNALRMTQLELREAQWEQGRELAGLRREMHEGFGTLATGMAEITTLLSKITEAEHGDG